MNTIEVLLKQANVPDRWKRIYPLEELVKLCASINDTETLRFGEFGASEKMDVDILRISHSLVSARMVDDKLMVTLKILDTPLGNIIKGLQEYKCPISARMRGTGKVDIDQSGACSVTDFSLITVDIENGQEDPTKGPV